MSKSDPKLEPGTVVFVLAPNGDKAPTFLRGVVIESEPGSLVVEFEVPYYPTVGASTQVSANLPHQLLVLSGTVTEFLQAVPSSRIRLAVSRNDEAMEMRQAYRVSVVGSNMHAVINEEDHCDVLDISATGLSLLAERPYKPGTEVDITVVFGPIAVSGRAVIRNIAQSAKQRYRYGCEAAPADRKMKDGLQRICSQAQRDRIRRMKEKGLDAA